MMFSSQVISLLAPGQGSQAPGMLTPWLDLPGATDRVTLWSKLTGLDLVRLGTTATADEITDTAIAQPLIVTAALLGHEAFAQRYATPPSAVIAGHSVGELAAAAIAGVISADDAVTLAAVRGAEMAKACAAEPTSMAAVLGGDTDEVLARLDELDLIPANRNAVGQIVAAGRVAAIDELVANPPEKARIRTLAVAGAFHTHYMASAQDAFAAAVANVVAENPTSVLLSNSDGQPVSSGADALNKLISQITSPVRWDLCTAYLREAQVSGLVEFPPAGTLVGIARRELKGTPNAAIKTPESLDELSVPGLTTLG